MVHRLTDDDYVEPLRAEVVLFDETRHRLQTQLLRLFHFDRRRVDQCALQGELAGEMVSDDPRGPADVEQCASA